MKLKKVLLAAVAVMLICAISVTGTLAYLSHKTGPVTNSFVSAGSSLFNDGGSLTLNEHGVVRNTSTGIYELTDEVVQGNNYSVLPGDIVPKDPTVHVVNKNDIPAYLYLEVVDSLDNKVSWTLDSVWSEVPNLQGKNGGQVYVYSNGTKLDSNSGTNGTLDVNVISGMEVSVDTDLTNESGLSLTFYAYMAQAVAGENITPEAVFNACFNSPNP